MRRLEVLLLPYVRREMHFLSRGNGVKVLPLHRHATAVHEEKLRVLESYSGKIVDSDMSHTVTADDSERATRHATSGQRPALPSGIS